MNEQVNEVVAVDGINVPEATAPVADAKVEGKEGEVVNADEVTFSASGGDAPVSAG